MPTVAKIAKGAVVVIDEAHNVCPAVAGDALTELAQSLAQAVVDLSRSELQNTSFCAKR